MICPRCSTRNELGASQCASCGAPFTRRAARRARPEPGAERNRYGGVPRQSYAEPAPAPAYGAATARPAAQPRQRRARPSQAGPGSRAIGGLIALLIITIVIISAAAWLSSGDTTQRLGDGISDRVAGVVPFAGDDDGTPDIEVPPAPAEPQGEQTYVLTEEELNQRVRNNPDAFSPASDVRIELGEGTVTVRFRAYGANGTYHGSLTTRDGVPVVADSTVDGALGFVIGSSQIDDALNREMANIVSEQNVSVESVHVRPGQMVFGISS
jgi:hypothetical protein